MTAENSDGHRQIERGTFLLQIRGPEVNNDPLVGRSESIVANCGKNAVPRFANRGVGQADNHKLTVASRRNVHFNIDKMSFDAINGSTPSFEKHVWLWGESGQGEISVRMRHDERNMKRVRIGGAKIYESIARRVREMRFAKYRPMEAQSWDR